MSPCLDHHMPACTKAATCLKQFAAPLSNYFSRSASRHVTRTMTCLLAPKQHHVWNNSQHLSQTILVASRHVIRAMICLLAPNQYHVWNHWSHPFQTILVPSRYVTRTRTCLLAPKQYHIWNNSRHFFQTVLVPTRHVPRTMTCLLAPKQQHVWNNSRHTRAGDAFTPGRPNSSPLHNPSNTVMAMASNLW